jgi:hypothetical protein
MLFRWLISTIGLAALKGEVSAMASRAAQRSFLHVIAFLLFVLAFGFALAAFTIWLAGVVGVIYACAIVAAVFAVVGIAIQISLAMTKRRPQSASPLADLAGPAAAGVAAQSGGILGSLAIVAIVGWLLGRQLFRK